VHLVGSTIRTYHDARSSECQKSTTLFIQPPLLGTLQEITWKQDRQCTYNVILWRVRVMFIPHHLSQPPETISLEE